MKFQLSSNATLFYRLFLPTLWLGFFGTFLIAVFFSEQQSLGGLNIFSLKWGLLVFVTTFIVIFRFTLWKILRIDADLQFMYITNYFRTIRYPLADIETIDLASGFIYRYGVVNLRGQGYFGQRINFIASKSGIEKFREAHTGIIFSEAT